jgi:hypothetical protein
MRAMFIPDFFKDRTILSTEITLVAVPLNPDDHKDEEKLDQLSKAIKANGSVTISSGDVSIVVSGDDLA